jgi:hypothetical protein
MASFLNLTLELTRLLQGFLLVPDQKGMYRLRGIQRLFVVGKSGGKAGGDVLASAIHCFF